MGRVDTRTWQIRLHHVAGVSGEDHISANSVSINSTLGPKSACCNEKYCNEKCVCHSPRDDKRLPAQVPGVLPRGVRQSLALIGIPAGGGSPVDPLPPPAPPALRPS